MECAKCGGETKGFKCAICGEAKADHDPEHQHAGRNHLMPMCNGCEEAEVHCSCSS